MRLLLMLLLFLAPRAAFSQTAPEEAAAGRYFLMPINLSLYVTQYRDYSLGRALGGGRPVVNYLALNVFSGKAARLRGIEAGGIGNVIDEDMFGIMVAGVGNTVGASGMGIQVAGVANVVDGSFAFMQAAGIANVVNGHFFGGQASLVANVAGGGFTGVRGSLVANVAGGSFSGVQLTGIANVSDGKAMGIQGAGIANVANADSRGIQFAGIANVGNSDVSGIQGAGIANVANGNSQGIRFAGVANVANGDFMGVQAAGIANVVNAHTNGIMLAGVANVSNGNLLGVQGSGIASVVNGSATGVQVSGLANVANGPRTGVQAAGLVNVASDARLLVQAGAINVSEGGKVLPLGLYSVVGDAPSYYDFWASETGFVNAGIRSGSERFHNLVFAGIQINDPFRWSLGWGLSVHQPVKGNLSVDVEGSVQHINEDEFWTSRKNLLTRARIAGVWQFTGTTAFYAGPTFNYLVSRVNDGSDIAPWSMADDRSGGSWTRSWIGIDLGIRITRSPEDMGLLNILDFLSI